MARDGYSTLRIKDGDAAELKRLQRQLSAHADHDVTQSQALGAAVALALEQLRAAAERLDDTHD
jgi:molybdopterin/thiamine biosynthesis adenylyltransferase